MNTFDLVESRTRDIDGIAHFYKSLFRWKVVQKVIADDLPVWLFDIGSEPRLQNLRRGGI